MRFRIISLFLLFLIIPIASASRQNDIVIQYKGSYLDLNEAVKKRGAEVIQHNQVMSYKFENKYYPITSEYTQLIFNNVKKVTLNFSQTFPNAKIYLDNYYEGSSDNTGSAHFPQNYPEVGQHTLKIIKKETIKKFNFNLVEKTTITCTGKNNFECGLEIEAS